MENRYRPLLALLTFLAVSSASLFPQTVGVAVFQEGTDKDVAPEEFLIGLGSACMDELFFSGFIATSEKPAVVGAPEFRANAAMKIEAAKEAFVAFELMVLVSASKSAYSKTGKIPKNAEYRFIDIGSGKILVQGALQGMEDGEDLQKRIDAWCAQASKTIMPACLNAIAERSLKVES